MRAAWLMAVAMTAQAQTVSETSAATQSTAAASTEQAADTKGWDGRLPGSPYDYEEALPITGGGAINIFIDNSLHLYGRGPRGGYRLAGTSGCGGYALHGDGRWRDGAAASLRGGAAGYIQGGTFGSTVRCQDGYPGLPLRPYEDPRGRIAPPYPPRY